MDLGKGLLRIGQVAELSGLSTRTIDYYTREGLLAFERSSANYRLYHHSVLETLERIKLLKKQRMSLVEIAATMQKSSNDEIVPILCEVQEEINCLQKKLTSLEEAMKNIPQNEKQLVYKELKEKLSSVKQLLILL
ncbi:MerR family transcriptional regulator [Halalkalibacterium ligniniphilum]|uniref:MerR family transcriptional regulator n=1 Tax=Halalkalibacterium ligniniphilum TaxID=1134413 RepID=UPI00034A471C|nr:MerR family transcriptional regulator [Halalkalibacterium ligniniphilum]